MSWCCDYQLKVKKVKGRKRKRPYSINRTSSGPCVPWEQMRATKITSDYKQSLSIQRNHSTCHSFEQTAPNNGEISLEMPGSQSLLSVTLSLSLSFSLYWHKSQQQLFVSKFIRREFKLSNVFFEIITLKTEGHGYICSNILLFLLFPEQCPFMFALNLSCLSITLDYSIRFSS